MGLLLLRPDGADDAAVRDGAVSGNLVASDEEDGVGALRDASTNAIGAASEFVCKQLGPDSGSVAGKFAGDEVTILVALASNLIDDGIGAVLHWEALEFWE